MTKKEEHLHPVLRQYYVDEAGDGTLFDKYGKVIIGDEGCSRFFIIGFLEVEDPIGLGLQLSALRYELLRDPYFKGVPSFDPKRKKTAVAFHANSDLPEVRHEVFKLLRDHSGLHFHAVIRDKLEVLNYVTSRSSKDKDYRYHPNELYDNMVPRLFHTSLHRAQTIKIMVSKRGRRNRSDALSDALQEAKQRFQRAKGITSNANIVFTFQAPPEETCLQAVDYFLWAVQRLYEKREDRFMKTISHFISLILDADDRRRANYGEYYSKKRPLDLVALKDRL